MIKHNFPLPVLFLAASLATPGAARSQDADAGRRLAERWCATCHVVGPGQARATSTGAPSFRDIAAQTAITPLALNVFLQTPHHQMPDLHLSRGEIDDVSAYILRLRQAGRR